MNERHERLVILERHDVLDPYGRHTFMFDRYRTPHLVCITCDRRR